MHSTYIFRFFSILFQVCVKTITMNYCIVCILIDDKLHSDTWNCLQSSTFHKLFERVRFNIDEWICWICCMKKSVHTEQKKNAQHTLCASYHISRNDGERQHEIPYISSNMSILPLWQMYTALSTTLKPCVVLRAHKWMWNCIVCYVRICTDFPTVY